MGSFSLDVGQTEKMAAEYRTLQIAPAQREICEAVANTILQYIKMNDLALRGFIWKAVKKWQQDAQMTARELFTASKEEKVAAGTQVFEHLKNTLIRLLRNKEESGRLDEAIQAAYKLYTEKYT